MESLVFIDTNVFLDFYRARSKDATLPLLNQIDENHDRIITTEQVEMEYKKNRNRVILETLRAHKPPDWDKMVIPAFLRTAQPTKMIQEARDKVEKQSRRITERLKKVLKDPVRYDPVYKVLQRLFKVSGVYNLSRRKKIRIAIRRRAMKRFYLGYPPRKNRDTSIGDAINWEWIIHCARESAKDIVIVSRDSDYGTTYRDHCVLNDWLRHEFKERVSKKRNIRLTEFLAKGYALAGITVSAEEKAQEEKIVKERRAEHEGIIRAIDAVVAGADVTEIVEKLIIGKKEFLKIEDKDNG